jgi:hypothetical protein
VNARASEGPVWPEARDERADGHVHDAGIGKGLSAISF